MIMIFDVTRNLHPMRECLGKTVMGTGNSEDNVFLTFEDGTILSFDRKGDNVLVSFREGDKHEN